MFRHIAWFNEATVQPDQNGHLTSPSSVTRRRCLIPARELEKCGVECSVFGNLENADPSHVSKHLEKLHADVVVVSCNAQSALVNLTDAAKHVGCYIVVDFGDQRALSVDQKILALSADLIIVATEGAAQHLKELGASALIVPDCDEEGSVQSVASLWLDCFKRLKVKPPVTANTNIPLTDNA